MYTKASLSPLTSVEVNSKFISLQLTAVVNNDMFLRHYANTDQLGLLNTANSVLSCYWPSLFLLGEMNVSRNSTILSTS
jgi:hypothetical protein